MARTPYKPTKSHIDTVRALKEKGATDKACADALGISINTFKRNKKGFFDTAIKEADNNRRSRLLALAEDTLEKEIKGYWIEEETTTTKTVGDQEFTETKIQKRWMRPNTPMNIMTLVNCSDDKSEIDWQPANKVENTIINSTTSDEAPAINWTKKNDDNS